MITKSHLAYFLFGMCFYPITATEAATNHLAFYLLQDKDARNRVDHTVKVGSLKLDPSPILSDSDFRAFRTNDLLVEMPTFTVKAEAARRLHDRLWELNGGRGNTYELCGPDTPFVLVASGEPVYRGVFTSPHTSRA